MPNYVEMVLPIGTGVTVCLVVSLTVDTLKEIRKRLIFLCNKSWRIYISILFAVSHQLSVILGFVRFIAFDTPEHI